MKSNHKNCFFYKKTGKGKPVMFLHGFMEDYSAWSLLTSQFEKEHTIIAVDLPGHGQTPCYAETHTMEMMAEGVFNILKAEKIERVILVGHSMGGYVALAFAENYPQLVEALILVNSTASADSETKKINRDRAVQAVESNKTLFVKTAIPNLFSEHNKTVFKEEIEQLTEKALKTPDCGIIAASKGMKIRKDRTSMLAKETYPKHYVIGENDPVIVSSETLQQAEKVGASYSLFDGGHMSFIENKIELYDSLKHFIDGL